MFNILMQQIKLFGCNLNDEIHPVFENRYFLMLVLSRCLKKMIIFAS